MQKNAGKKTQKRLLYKTNNCRDLDGKEDLSEEQSKILLYLPGARSSSCNHCHSCNVCVLRRDHHCTLLGKCVGFTNYRYFICSLFHGWIALLLTTILNAEIFINLLNEGNSFHSFFLLFMPWMMLLTAVSTSKSKCLTATPPFRATKRETSRFNFFRARLTLSTDLACLHASLPTTSDHTIIVPGKLVLNLKKSNFMSLASCLVERAARSFPPA
ncbi:uncharacterized protein [Hyperolius riggenbachi]|uniref:uncharacterized protein n=1 Tax=Hyperolius riggenbachi TaxID=752182 RepID=UPI0035A2EFF3